MKNTTLAWAIRTALIASACVQTSGFAVETPASSDQPAATSEAQPQAANKDDNATNLGTVTVTGIVGSLNRSIDAKRSETAIVDAVSAEDVGKFPDNNIAESLQRITGVEITRDGNGEGQYVTIRGLPTDFTYFTLNGLPVSSISGQGTRSFDFSVLATDFISTLKVYKSSRADLDEGGIGGNIDVQTVTPFGIGKERAVLSAKMQGNPGGYTNRNYPDVSGIYSNIFADGTLGLTVGFDWNKRYYLNENSIAMSGGGWQYAPYCINPTDPTNANGSCAGGTKTIASQLFNLSNAGSKLDTKTGYLSAQWKPFDSTVVTLDGMYVRKTTDNQQSTLTLVPSYPWGTFTVNGPALPPLQTDANGVATRWNTPYTWIDANTTFMHNAGETKNVSLNVDTKLSNWEFSGTAQVSTSPTSARQLNGQVGLGPGLGQVPNYMAGYQMNGSAPPTVLLPPGFSSLPASAWGNDEVTPVLNSGGDQLKLLKGGITRTFDDGPIQDIKFGAKVYRRDLPTSQHVWYYNNVGSSTPFTTAFVPNPVGNLLPDAGGIGVNNLPFINYQLWMNQYFGGSFNNMVGSKNSTDYGAATSDIIERGRSAYVMADFRFDNGSLPIYGNVGVRYQETSTQIFYNGFSLSDPTIIFDPTCPENQDGTSCIRFRAPTSHTSQTGTNHSLLPSLNLAADLRDDMVLRFSASQTMSRPTLGYMNPAVSLNPYFFTISSGNPNLAPFKSTNYDLSYEWYFRPTSVLSVAVYDKEMSGFIQQVTEPYTFRNTPFNYTTYVNGSDAYVRGFEVDYKQVFDFLPGFWSGFGMEFNFTYSKGQQSAFNVAASGDIPAISRPASPFLGLTPRTTNLALFYEKYGFSASLSANRRGQYLIGTDTVPAIGGAQLFSYINTRTIADFHAAYSVNDHLKVFADVTNLTDKPITGSVTLKGLEYPGAWQYNGRRVDIGATYNF